MATFTSNLDAKADAGGGGGGADLAATLVLGNLTSGTDVVLSSGDEIVGAPAVGASGNDGFPLILRGGDGDGAGGIGPIQSRTTGNARGKGAVDFQIAGTLAQVAAPDYSVMMGEGNTIGASDYAGVVMGTGNTLALGSYANAMFGKGNDASGGTGGYGNLIGGFSHNLANLDYFGGNTVSGWDNHVEMNYTVNNIFAGRLHRVYGGGVVGFGANAVFGQNHKININANTSIYMENNLFSGTDHRAFGGVRNSGIIGKAHDVLDNGDYLFLAGGSHLVEANVTAASAVGKLGSVHTDFAFFVSRGGNGQAVTAPSGATNAAAPTLTPEFNIGANRIVGFQIIVTAIDSANLDSAMWIITGAIANIAGTTALVGSPLVQAAAGTWSAVASSIPTFNTGAAGWTIDIAADNVNDTLEITGGSATATTDWNATLTASETRTL